MVPAVAVRGRPEAGAHLNAAPASDLDRAARVSVYVVFIGSGFAAASWISRIPDVRDQLQASPSTLGLVLLAMAAGSLVAMPLAGLVITRLGPARTVTAFALLLSAGLMVVAVGYLSGIAALVVGLFFVGLGYGTWDVAMNVEGAAVEQRLGYAIMPKFHAGFSIGTVGGALVGAAMVALGVPVTLHLIAVAVLVAIVVPGSTRRFLSDVASPAPTEPTPPRHPLRAWTEPRTLLIGIFVLCMAFTEGTGNDWLALAVIDGYAAAPVLGPLTLALFLAAMTTGRWFGPPLIDRYGRVLVVRVSALIAFVGLLLVIFGHWLPVAMLGAVLLGLGSALGFPIGMSAAADDPAKAAGRVSVVASIGYTAFLAGPPLIGLLGDHLGILRALTVTLALLGLAALVGGATRPPADAARAQDENRRTLAG